MRVVEQHVREAVHTFFTPEWALLVAGRVSARGRRVFRHRLTGEVSLKDGEGIDLSSLAESDVRELLLQLGAPARCVLIKDGLQRDEIASLDSALHRTFLAAEGALISCIPGRLCLLQCDHGRTRLLLRASLPSQHPIRSGLRDEGLENEGGTHARNSG